MTPSSKETTNNVMRFWLDLINAFLISDALRKKMGKESSLKWGFDES